MSLLGCLVLVTYQFGAFVARLMPGFSQMITKESSKEGTPPRTILTLGILMQIPFYVVLYFKTDVMMHINLGDDQYVLQVILYGIILGTGFLVGYAQVATEFACKKYAY